MYAPGPKHLWIGLLVLIVIRFVALGVVEQSRTERSRNGIDCHRPYYQDCRWGQGQGKGK